MPGTWYYKKKKKNDSFIRFACVIPLLRPVVGSGDIDYIVRSLELFNNFDTSVAPRYPKPFHGTFGLTDRQNYEKFTTFCTFSVLLSSYALGLTDTVLFFYFFSLSRNDP